MTEHKLGLITVLYNSSSVLEDFFRSVHTQDYPDYILYMVDNSPSPETRLQIQELAGRYPLVSWVHIESEENNGIAGGNNTGIRRALEDGCQACILLNNDIVFLDPRMISNLVTFARENNISLLAPKIYFYNTDIIWYAGGYMLPYRLDIRQKGYLEKEQGKYNRTEETAYAPTCFVYVSKEVFQKVGLIDEKYFVYVDDTDFIYRALDAGFRLFYYPHHHLYHKVGISTGGLTSDVYIYYNTRNRIYYARKHFKPLKRSVGIAYVLLSMSVKSVLRNINKRKLFMAFRDGFKM